MQGQNWQTCDTKTKAFIKSLIPSLQTELQDNLLSIWLHGSLAMGSYFTPKSDIDILVVVKKPLEKKTSQNILETLAKHDEKRPYLGHLELSIVLAQKIKNPKHPIAFELHYGEDIQDTILDKTYDYSQSKGLDPDLTAHLMVTKHAEFVFLESL